MLLSRSSQEVAVELAAKRANLQKPGDFETVGQASELARKIVEEATRVGQEMPAGFPVGPGVDRMLKAVNAASACVVLGNVAFGVWAFTLP